MTPIGILQIGLCFLIILALTRPLGRYMARVFEGRRTLLSFALRPLERGIYRLGGIDPEQEQHWTRYAASLLAFSF